MISQLAIHFESYWVSPPKSLKWMDFFYSDNVIQISSGINLVLIHCDLIDGAYNDGIRTNTIFSLSAFSTTIGYKFNMKP